MIYQPFGSLASQPPCAHARMISGWGEGREKYVWCTMARFSRNLCRRISAQQYVTVPNVARARAAELNRQTRYIVLTCDIRKSVFKDRG